MKKICIVIPVYKEEEVIQSFHQEITKVFDKLKDKYIFRMIYVLDRSPDKTEQLLSKIVEQYSSKKQSIEILVMSKRFGHQAALFAGMKAADGDAVIMLDSDLQHPPELIPELLILFEDGADIVQAIRKDHLSIHPLRKFASDVFYSFLRRISDIDLQRGAADYRLLSTRVVKIFQEQLPETNPFLRGLISWVGFNVRFISFECKERKSGQSKYNIGRLINFALTGICSFSKAPLRWCSVVGILLALCSFLMAILGLYVHFTKKAEVPGWASLFCAMSFIGGVQLLFLGIIGEYISLIFDEVKKRPTYIIEKIIKQRDVKSI